MATINGSIVLVSLPAIFTGIIGAIAFIIGFVVLELLITDPIFNMRLFRIRACG